MNGRFAASGAAPRLCGGCDARAVSTDMRAMVLQVPGCDLFARCPPHVVVLFRVGKKIAEKLHAVWVPRNVRVQPDVHHLARGRALAIQLVELAAHHVQGVAAGHGAAVEKCEVVDLYRIGYVDDGAGGRFYQIGLVVVHVVAHEYHARRGEYVRRVLGAAQ